ncbi:hypothetical protein [Pedococcus soli]
MGLFSRRKGSPGPDEPSRPGSGGHSGPRRVDDALTMFEESDAATFRSTVRETLAEMGFEVTVLADHVTTDDGRQWGLWNLGAGCAGTPHDQWPATVRAHFTTVMAGADDEPLTAAYLDAHVVSRLMEEDGLRQTPDWVDRGLEWAPGVRQVVVVDTPETVQVLPPAAFEEFRPLGPWFDRGLANLRAQLDTETFQLEAVTHGDSTFWCLLGDSVYTASLALLLPDVVQRYAAQPLSDKGVLFAIPFRHQLAFHVVDEPQAALNALMVMPQFAAAGFLEGSGPVSPSVFWWQEGRVRQVSTMTADRRLSVTPGPELEVLLGMTRGDEA